MKVSRLARFVTLSLSTSFVPMFISVGAQPAVAETMLEQPEAAAQPIPTLPETNVGGDNLPASQPNYDPTAYGSPSVLDGTIFSYGYNEGYRADNMTTGTIVNIPDIQSPMTVSPVTRDVMNDQQAIRFNDVLRDAGAVVPVGSGLVGDSIFIRGQETGSRDFRKNGFFDPTLAKRDLQNIERIEILKGPASVIYGTGQPSGTVNFITKQPLDANFATAGFMFGSFDLQRYTVDANATGDGELFRVNAAYENSNSFRDFVYNERTFVAPAVTWVLDPDTTSITWQGEFLHDHRLGDTGMPAIGGRALALPISRYVGEPGTDFQLVEEYRQQLYLTHVLDDNWTLFAGGESLFFDAPATQTFAAANLGGTQFARIQQNYQDEEQAQSGMVNLAGDVDGYYFNHKLLFGTEQVYYDADASILGLAVNTPFNPFDVSAPVYGVSPPLGVAYTFDAPVFRQERRGYYLQDYITLNENWQLLGGVRFDDVHFVYQRDIGLGPIRNDQHFDRTSPRGGIVYQPIPDVMAVYFNYSMSFNAPTGSLGFAAEPVQPELGEQFELGVKTMLTEELSVNVAGFHIARENVPFADFDPLTFAPRFFQLGQQRSQGVEINVLGQITDYWSIIGNWAYTDTEVTDPANPLLVGQRARNVPLNNGSFWTRYNFIQNDCRTFGAALGLVGVGDRTANLEATQQLPGYYRWDSGVYYRQGRVNAALYLENFGDIKYAVSSIDALQIMPGAPFNAQAQVWFTF